MIRDNILYSKFSLENIQFNAYHCFDICLNFKTLNKLKKIQRIKIIVIAFLV